MGEFMMDGKKFILKVVCLVTFGLGLVPCATLFAETINLDEIVVTPYRYDESLEKTSSSVTVVSSDDIRRSNAQRLVDVLRDIPGVSVRDYYGNGTKSVVDVAGFGEQAALNVLVLIDGRRVNDVDLSGVDWSQVPLEQVERIEVIRAGSAGVLYGDNASSGVINIITKSGFGAPKVTIKTEYGSYDRNAQKVSVGGATAEDKLTYWLSGGRDSTNGYRDNTFNKSSDFVSKTAYKFSDVLSAHVYTGFYASTYGLPGALFQHHIDQNGRRFARYGDDHVNNKDYYVVTGLRSDFKEAGVFDADVSYRHKETDSYFLTSHNPTQKNRIDTIGLTPKYTLSSELGAHENKFVTGLDLYRTFYRSNAFLYSNENDLQNLTRISKDSVGAYAQDEFSLTSKLFLVNGLRYEAARYVFNYHDFNTTGFGHPYPDQDKKDVPQMRAFNSGLVYKYRDGSSVFLDVSKSFRFPEVDEFTYQDASFQQQLNTELKPQSSINYQLGVRHTFQEGIKGSVSLFRMNVQNELYFNSLGGPYGFGQNENYDKTVHQGLEAALEARLNSWITSFGNYTFTEAYFQDGPYGDNEVPIVPRHKGTAGLRFSLPGNFSWNVQDSYVGKRYALNDQANSHGRVNDYMLADTSLSWRGKDTTATFSINNVFDIC